MRAVDYLEIARNKFPKLIIKRSIRKDGEHVYHCECPDHGKFTVVGRVKLVQRKYGCGECGRLARNEANTKWSTSALRAHLRKVHGNKYDLSKVVYRGYDQPITLICKKHGPWDTTILSQTVAQSTTGVVGQGCPDCWSERRSENVNIETLHAIK